MTAEDLKLKPINEQVQYILDILNNTKDIDSIKTFLLEFEDILRVIKLVNTRCSANYDGEDKITYKDNSTIMDEVVDLLK